MAIANIKTFNPDNLNYTNMTDAHTRTTPINTEEYQIEKYDNTQSNSETELSIYDYFNFRDYVEQKCVYSRIPISYSDLIKTEEFQNIISNLGLDINGLQTYEEFHNYIEGQKIKQLGMMLEYINQICVYRRDSISFNDYQETEEFKFFVKEFKLGQDHFDSLFQFQTYINQYATEDKITQINENLTTFKTERDNFYTEVSDVLGEDFDGMITQYNNDINNALMTSEGNFANLIERIRNGYRVADSEELEWVANVIYNSLDNNQTYTLYQIKNAISDPKSSIDFEDIFDLYTPASREILQNYDPTLISNLENINNIYDKKLEGKITGPNGETLSFNDCLILKEMYDQNIVGLETSLQDANQTLIQLQYQVIMQSNDYQNYDYYHFDNSNIDTSQINLDYLTENGIRQDFIQYVWGPDENSYELSPIDYLYYVTENSDVTMEELLSNNANELFYINAGNASYSGDKLHSDMEDLLNLLRASKYDESLVKMYNYIYYTQGLEAANKYIYDTENNVNETLAQVYVQESLKNLKPGQPIVLYDEITGEKTEIELEVSNGKLIVKGLGDGVSQFFSGVGGWFNQDRNKTVFEWQQYYFALALMTPEQKIEAGLIDENGNSISPFIDFTKDYSQGGISSVEYNISSSIGNMLPSMALSAVNPMLGSTAMAVGAGGNSYRDAYTSGYDLEKSLTYGMISGISEAALEKMLGSIPGLGKESETVIPSMSKWIMSCWDEGKEEFVQEGFDIILKNVLFGEEVNLEDALKQMGVAGLYGAATGGIMNGVQMTGTSVKLNINNTESNIRLIIENNNGALNNSQIAEMFGVTEQDIVNISNKMSKENSSSTRITNNPDGKLRIGEAALVASAPPTEIKTDSTGFEINEFGEVIRGEKESSQPHDDDITYFEPPSKNTTPSEYSTSSPFMVPAGDLDAPSIQQSDNLSNTSTQQGSQWISKPSDIELPEGIRRAGDLDMSPSTTSTQPQERVSSPTSINRGTITEIPSTFLDETGILTESPEYREIFIDQMNRYNEVRQENIEHTAPTVDSNGKVILPEGTLFHGSGKFSEEKINSISKDGIVTGQAIGIEEDGETFYCADFYRNPTTQKLSELSTTVIGDEIQGRTPFGTKSLHDDRFGFIIEPNNNQKLQQLLEYDPYRTGTDGSKIAQEFVNMSGLPFETAELASSILYGVPSNAISGIVVGNNLANNPSTIETIKHYFPNCYITTKDGTLIYNPFTIKANTTQTETIQTITQNTKTPTETRTTTDNNDNADMSYNTLGNSIDIVAFEQEQIKNLDNIEEHNKLIELAKQKGMTLKELASQNNYEKNASEAEKDMAIIKALQLNKQAKEQEQQITKDLEALQVDNQRYLKGLEHKIKEVDSIERKILSDIKEKDISVEQAAERVNDSLRYTMISTEENITSDITECISSLIDKNYKVVKFKNSFGKDRYKGINIALQSPTGQNFELQFHTEKSFIVKDSVNHLHYEIYRNSASTDNEKELAHQVLVETTKAVDIPSGILDYKLTDALSSKYSNIAELMPEVYEKEHKNK